MARTSRKQRFSMFAVSAAMVGGGVLLPTSAFAAPATPQASEAAATLVADHAKSGHESTGKDNRGHQGKKHNGKKNQGKKHGKIKDVKNMPGCKFYKGTVYCEHKPEKPAPAPETAPDRETGQVTDTAPETAPDRETGEALVEQSSAASG
ncbi:hypothetical protein ACGFZK_35590 [Streptomyces sp. NPDC048257]|uniref:hypothetical protein n=1 Tax=Streptomyces sp. NPDC048257 TaxID=3365526 RepID=UPI00371DF8A5